MKSLQTKISIITLVTALLTSNATLPMGAILNTTSKVIGSTVAVGLPVAGAYALNHQRKFDAGDRRSFFFHNAAIEAEIEKLRQFHSMAEQNLKQSHNQELAVFAVTPVALIAASKKLTKHLPGIFKGLAIGVTSVATGITYARNTYQAAEDNVNAETEILQIALKAYLNAEARETKELWEPYIEQYKSMSTLDKCDFELHKKNAIARQITAIKAINYFKMRPFQPTPEQLAARLQGRIGGTNEHNSLDETMLYINPIVVAIPNKKNNNPFNPE